MLLLLFLGFFQIARIPAISPNRRIIPKIPGFRPPGPEPICSAADRSMKTKITPTVARILEVLVIIDDFEIVVGNGTQRFTYWRWWGIWNTISPTFAQMPNRITNVEFITVSPTIANTMCLLHNSNQI